MHDSVAGSNFEVAQKGAPFERKSMALGMPLVGALTGQ